FFQTMATVGREPPPPAFPCPICLNECYPWRNPVLLQTDEKACEHHLCGEPYCWEALKSGRKNGRSNASDALQNLKDDPAPAPPDTRVLCPSCKGNVVGAINFEEWTAFGKRQYLSFKVQCPRWKSCGWEGAMSEVEAHLSKCQAFRCENCQAHVKERGMELFRPVERIWKDQHDETCPDYLVKCELCPAFEGTRDALARHLLSSTQEHLRLSSKAIASLMREVDDLKAQLVEMSGLKNTVEELRAQLSMEKLNLGTFTLGVADDCLAISDRDDTIMELRANPPNDAPDRIRVYKSKSKRVYWFFNTLKKSGVWDPK
ncbi:hypothetical protein DFJ74DRAFT_655028, partial [Hyaloraphidium curvatum]